MSDETGKEVWRREQTPFGETTLERGTVNEQLRFPGQYWDAETGKHYNYHRDYDPILGRYFEADPVGQKGGINPFTYAQNNPSINKDILGLKCDSQTVWNELSLFDNAYQDWKKEYKGGWGPKESCKYWLGDPNAKVCVDQADDLTDYLNQNVKCECCSAETRFRYFPLPHADVIVKCKNCEGKKQLMRRYDPYWAIKG